jgi:hypothetical protein
MTQGIISMNMGLIVGQVISLKLSGKNAPMLALEFLEVGCAVVIPLLVIWAELSQRMFFHLLKDGKK